jgi:hypothetical protein
MHRSFKERVMIDLLAVLRRKGNRAPAASRPGVMPPASAAGPHAAPRPEDCAGAEQVPTEAPDVGCDPYNSGVFDRADSWSRVNRRS